MGGQLGDYMEGHSHRIERCKHGTVIAQCRCPDKNKRTVEVPCPGPTVCNGDKK